MFNQLKGLIQNGERYIVVEGGRPEYVFMRFEDYAALVGGKSARAHGNPGSSRSSDWQHANAELESARATNASALEPHLAAEPFPAPSDPSTIRLEDLPL